MSHRAMKYLNDKRIVYRRYSPDKPTASYDWGWYYADGTYGYYSLFNTKAKINTYKSLKWHLLVLWYLNPDMDKTQFSELASVITHKSNGFTTFNLSANMLKEIINDEFILINDALSLKFSSFDNELEVLRNQIFKSTSVNSETYLNNYLKQEEDDEKCMIVVPNVKREFFFCVRRFTLSNI